MIITKYETVGTHLRFYLFILPGVLELEFPLKLCTGRPPRTLTESDSTICCMCTIVSSWRWALEARNM